MMTIETPEQLVKAINMLMLQMNRPQRKQFLMWVKGRRKEYDFLYPEGYKGEPNVKQDTTAEPVVVAPDAPVLITPEPGIVDATGAVVSSQDTGESANSR